MADQVPGDGDKAFSSLSAGNNGNAGRLVVHHEVAVFVERREHARYIAPHMPVRPLLATQLDWRLPDDTLRFATTAEVAPLDSFIGQDQALSAIRRAVDVRGPGFNVFVAGPRATGRLGSIERILQELEPVRRAARDFAYARNFLESGRPRLLTFPPGKGHAFRKELLKFAAVLVEEIPVILNRDEVRRAREEKRQAVELAQHGAMARLELHAAELGFVIGSMTDDAGGSSGPMVLWRAPDLDESEENEAEAAEPRVMSRAEVLVTVEHEQLELPLPIAELMARFDSLEAELARAVDLSRQKTLEALRGVSEVEQKAVRDGVTPLFKDLSKRWKTAKGWLGELLEELIESPEWFDSEEPDHETLFSSFTVNLVHVGNPSRQATIVPLTNPTWAQLVGGFEGEPGSFDHRSVRAGAIVDADGGWLLLNAADLLQEPGVWKVLKRALVSGEFDIQNPDGAGGGPGVLRPEALPIDLKVVLAGDLNVFAALYYGDPDFRYLFKIKAEFEEDAPCKPETLEAYAQFCARVIKKEGLPHFTRAAVADVLQWAVRHAGRGGRITTQMSMLADLLREAACETDADVVHGRHVYAALRARRLRDGLAERRTLELIERGVVRVQVDGAVVGQINALVVYHVGGHDFGRPMRITATVGAGRSGVASIEREVGLSGRSHDKGMQILTGWLRAKLGQTRTFAFAASITFEQSYGRIDGDSATITEMTALLSALSGLPVDQGIAVTGSLNQFGEVQAVGGINEKIEGYYATCKVMGLTGRQGVIMPAANVPDLCLDAAVVEACASGRFHVWAVSEVAEGVELLLGAPLGALGEDGRYPPESVLGRAGRSLDHYQEVARLQGRPKRPAAEV